MKSLSPQYLSHLGEMCHEYIKPPIIPLVWAVGQADQWFHVVHID